MHAIKTDTRSKKITLVMLVGLLIILAAGAYLAYSYSAWPFNDRQSETSKQEAANSSDETNPQQKQNLPSSDELAKAGANKTTDQIPVAATGALNITTLTQRNDDIVYSASLQNVDTSGTCSALFEHADGAARPVTRTTSSTGTGCPETAIPQAEFVARGTWHLTLRYYVNDTQLVATKSIEVR